jgi:hypothetical protein
VLSTLGSLAPMVPPSFTGSAARPENGSAASSQTVPVTPGGNPGQNKAESGRPANENQRTSEPGERRNPRGESGEQGLSEEQLRTLTDLKARDREVRAHESAHQAVGGQYAGSISYVYERGPDGAQYAVGGEVSIDVSPVAGDPQATIEKMRVVRAAALAPAQPSGQDRAVAAEAMQQMLQAQSEMAMESQEGPRSAGEAGSEEDSGGTTRTGYDGTNTYQQVSRLEADSSRSRTPVLDAIA